MDIQNDRIWYLVSVKLSGEASDAELAELDTRLKEHPGLGFQVDIIEKAWNQKPQPAAGLDSSYSRHLQRLSNHLSAPALQYEQDMSGEVQEKRIIPRYKRWWLAAAAAAAVVLVFVLLPFFRKESKGSSLSQNSVSTKMGSKSKIQLPDGTQVWLNADSKLTYDEKFNNSNREVYLTGEAYFDVVKDKSRPFIISTATVDIRVLGTAFNVRSYPNDKTTETALIRGSVEVTLKTNPDKKFILKPNEKLVVQNTPAPDTTKLVTKLTREKAPVITWAPVRPVDTKDSITYETSWVKNYLSFDEETLQQAALKIERWYDVKVIIEGDSLKNASSTFTAVFEDENLAMVMEALRMAGNFNYTIKRKEVLIRP